MVNMTSLIRRSVYFLSKMLRINVDEFGTLAALFACVICVVENRSKVDKMLGRIFTARHHSISIETL